MKILPIFTVSKSKKRWQKSSVNIKHRQRKMAAKITKPQEKETWNTL
jgi:cell fate (sporulation/competence/biofilm development) regulator YmcA (YheA/YmcA/DUF963 family)